jgi:chromosome segregation ATPase
MTSTEKATTTNVYNFNFGNNSSNQSIFEAGQEKKFSIGQKKSDAQQNIFKMGVFSDIKFIPSDTHVKDLNSFIDELTSNRKKCAMNIDLARFNYNETQKINESIKAKQEKINKKIGLIRAILDELEEENTELDAEIQNNNRRICRMEYYLKNSKENFTAITDAEENLKAKIDTLTLK